MCRLFLKNKKGFTLVELMIVVLILGLLTAIGIPSYRVAKIYAERRIVETNLKMIDSAIEVYYATGNTLDLVTGDPWESLVPNYIHARIQGPGTARYLFTDHFSDIPCAIVVSDEPVGDYVLRHTGFYRIGNLPW